jgi:hypothetical protein
MKKINKLTIFFLIALVAFAGCKEFPGAFEGERVVARVGRETLRVMDVQGVFPVGIAGADSIKWVENYVDRWVRDNLKLQEANRLFGENEADEGLVEAYRNSLILRRLEQNLVDRTAGDSLYTEKELRDYYEAHKADFTLDRTIVRGRVVAFPSSFRQKARLKELFASWNSTNREEGMAIANKNGFALTEIDKWIEYPAFLEKLPTRRNETYDNLAKRMGVQEMIDGEGTWWFVIEEVRTPGAATPYEMVSDMVRMTVAARRRGEILREYEDSVYRQALFEEKVAVEL